MPYAVAMAKMMAQWIIKSATPLPDIIVPMPLHRQRINQRGFNQATEISRILGRQLCIPVEPVMLSRVKNTVTQTGLNEKMRRQNMKDAFVVKSTRQPGHVALVDDVVTSGSTVNAASKALVTAGVRGVSVWAVAKT
jgi:ComF family protein